MNWTGAFILAFGVPVVSAVSLWGLSVQIWQLGLGGPGVK